MSNTRYNEEMLLQIVKLVLKGDKSAAKIAKELGINQNTVSRWVQEYRNVPITIDKEASEAAKLVLSFPSRQVNYGVAMSGHGKKRYPYEPRLGLSGCGESRQSRKPCFLLGSRYAVQQQRLSHNAE